MAAQILLMVDPVGDQVFPVSPRAIEAISAPVSRILARNCVALFLDHHGSVRRIEDITPRRTGPWAKLRLLLAQRELAAFTWAEVDAPLEDIRTMIVDAVIYMRQREAFKPGDWWLYTAPEPEVREALSRATTLAELYAALRLPTEKECLDAL